MPIVMKKIIFMIILLIILSCASQKQHKNKDDYVLLNLLTSKLVEENKKALKEKTYIYLRENTESGDNYLKSTLYETFWLGFQNYNPGYYVSKEEIEYLKKQLNSHLLLNFSKINSKTIKKYIKPFTRKEKDTLYTNDDFYKDLSKIKYNISRSIYSSDNNFAYIFLSYDDVGMGIKIFKKENNKWRFYKNIGLAVY